MRVERAPSAPKARRSRSPIQAHLEAIHARYAQLDEGEVATYIPELTKANPDWFAICLATNDGHLYEIGDSERPFTIQSISKPFVYGLAIEDRGRDAVLRRIGVEPTGDAFNAISLESGSGRPLNPMINAGAIAATAMVAGHSPDDTQARLLAVLSTYAGRALEVDEAVYESERSSGHRNRAIGHMLRNFDIVTADPEAALDLYFRQCSVTVTCRDLAFMAATLANAGLHPLSGERAIREDLVADVLSVMTTCGMYDFAGEWVYRVGMPAKSGVGGGILAVLPGQFGVGVFRLASMRAATACAAWRSAATCLGTSGCTSCGPRGSRARSSAPPMVSRAFDRRRAAPRVTASCSTRSAIAPPCTSCRMTSCSAPWKRSFGASRKRATTSSSCCSTCSA
jgi:glutaminase